MLPYCSLLQGIHVVSPNKRLTAGPLDDYLAVKQLQRECKAHYMYEVSLIVAVKQRQRECQAHYMYEASLIVAVKRLQWGVQGALCVRGG